MALTTASSKLRSTILFNSKDEQVLFKRSSADPVRAPSEASHGAADELGSRQVGRAAHLC